MKSSIMIKIREMNKKLCVNDWSKLQKNVTLNIYNIIKYKSLKITNSNCDKIMVHIHLIICENECITSLRVLPFNMIKFTNNKCFLFTIFEKNIKKKVLYKSQS